MSINLLDMLKTQVTGSLAKQASDFLGEPEENVTSGLENIFPALLGSIINKSSEPSGNSDLIDIIAGLDMDMLSDIGSLFGGGSNGVNGLLNSGGGIVESLLGNKTGGLIEIISKLSGLKSGSSSSLLKMAAPFLLGVIGKQIKGKGLSFLSDLLMSQKDHVQSTLPSGIGHLLGFSDVAKNAVGSITTATENAITETSNIVKETASANRDQKGKPSIEVSNNKGGWIKWVIPLILIAILLSWGIQSGWFDGTTKDAIENEAESVSNVENKSGEATNLIVKKTNKGTDASTSNDIETVSNYAKTAFSIINETGKMALDNVTFAANSAGTQMMNYINEGFKGDGKFTFKNLTFDIGSAKITNSSVGEVDNLAFILKAYPNVKIKINGHTDNQGEANNNKILSEARAMAVKGRLIEQGVDRNRIIAAGYGSEDPIATNETEEGRAKNRRIEVTISR